MKLASQACIVSALLATTASLLLAPAVAAAPPGAARPWEHERSDLAPDPRIRFGRLANGLRYAWMRNGEPRERTYLRLHIDAGSLAEEDGERGMAHFLEHMAFNGTTRFPGTTLVEWFQEHGMAFGADLNASTSYSETVYMLDLPQSDGTTLGEGLEVLREWASGLLLEDREVEGEKAVIDGEEAGSDSARRRVGERVLALKYAGTRYPLRPILGDAESRAAFSAGKVRRFYERWYRPENMTVVVVGDLGTLDPAPLIARSFGDLAAPGRPVEPEPARGDPELAERCFAVHESDLPGVSIHLERLTRYVERPDRRATRQDDVDLACARRMLNLRLGELARKEGTPFLGAGVSRAGGLEVFDGEELAVTAEPAKWEEALAAAEGELRRALAYGFRQAELDEVRAGWRRALDEAVEREPTRASPSLAAEILAAAEGRVVPTGAATEREVVAPVLEALTPEACHAALAAAWSAGVSNLYATGNLDLGAGAADTLRAALARARARPVEPLPEIELEPFAYRSVAGKSGAIAGERRVEDLDAWLIAFENGVRLNLKATDFKERQILVRARVAEGLLTVDPAEYAAGWVGVQAFPLGGLGRHDADELRRLTAGKQVGLGFGWSTDAFTLIGQTTAEDLEMQLEILCAHLQDPGWRDDGIRMLRDRLPLMFERLEHTSSGPLQLEFMPALFHGDRRFAELPERAAIEAVTMDGVRTWLEPHLAAGPVEVTLVGDLDLEAAKAVAARTLGLLPARRPRLDFTERRRVEPPRSGFRLERAIATGDDKSSVLIVFPTDDGFDTGRRRTIHFLAGVLEDRLRVEVRERLGAAYSPAVAAEPSTVFPGVGILTIRANVEPGKVETFAGACLAAARALHDAGVTEEEVKRLVEPKLKEVRNAQRTNNYWLGALAEAQSRPESLDEPRTVAAFYRELRAAAVTELAGRYLAPERASILVVNPEAPAGGGAPSGWVGTDRR